MDNLLDVVGLRCQKGHEVSVLKSGAGYYVGTYTDEGPNCRLSMYYGKTTDDPIMNIQRDCMENQYCNGNQIGGCKFCYSGSISTLRNNHVKKGATKND